MSDKWLQCSVLSTYCLPTVPGTWQEACAEQSLSCRSPIRALRSTAFLCTGIRVSLSPMADGFHLCLHPDLYFTFKGLRGTHFAGPDIGALLTTTPPRCVSGPVGHLERRGRPETSLWKSPIMYTVRLWHTQHPSQA